MPSSNRALTSSTTFEIDDLINELNRADAIIATMLRLMSAKQKNTASTILEDAGISPEGMTRYHERKAVIAAARNLGEERDGASQPGSRMPAEKRTTGIPVAAVRQAQKLELTQREISLVSIYRTLNEYAQELIHGVTSDTATIYPRHIQPRLHLVSGGAA